MYFLALISTGIVIGLIVAVPIGPVNLICIRRSLAYGPSNGLLSGLGAALGDGTFAVVTAFGLTAISQWIEGYSLLITVLGGTVLLGFGLHIFNADVSLLRDDEGAPLREPPASSVFKTMGSTFALTIANPATLLGFAALFAGIGSLAGGQATFLDAAIMVIGVMLGSSMWWFMLTTFVGTFHHRIDTKVMRNLNHGFGIVVTAFGVLVLARAAMLLF